MGDSEGEKQVKETLGYSEFSYDGARYKITKNEKPRPETKTDFYILAENLDAGGEREFKISYKKPSYVFIENKIKPDRIKAIFGDDWSRILQDQILRKTTPDERRGWKKKKPEESLQESFEGEPLVDFKRKKIALGWRYEIESLDKAGKRTHSGNIEQNIAPQIVWGDGCRDDMRDALVNDVKIINSGIPDFILVAEPDEIQTAQDAFDRIEDIQGFARQHWKMRAAFLKQNYRYSCSTESWVTEGWSRTFAVWIRWQVFDGKLDGRPVFDKPLEKTARDVFCNLSDCLEEMNIRLGDGFDIETLDGRLATRTGSIR